MRFEIDIPDDWSPGLGLAVAKMIQESLKEGFPIVVPVRKDATADQVQAAFGTVKEAFERAGLAA